MKFGLTAKEFETLRSLLIRPLIEKEVRLWVFGSRARGDYQKFSDIDILFEESGSRLADAFLAQVKDDLEESDLPYKVDLVRAGDLAESYRKSVMTDRVPLTNLGFKT